MTIILTIFKSISASDDFLFPEIWYWGWGSAGIFQIWALWSKLITSGLRTIGLNIALILCASRVRGRCCWWATDSTATILTSVWSCFPRNKWTSSLLWLEATPNFLLSHTLMSCSLCVVENLLPLQFTVSLEFLRLHSCLFTVTSRI